jgi:hypothetical protein
MHEQLRIANRSVGQRPLATRRPIIDDGMRVPNKYELTHTLTVAQTPRAVVPSGPRRASRSPAART